MFVARMIFQRRALDCALEVLSADLADDGLSSSVLGIKINIGLSVVSGRKRDSRSSAEKCWCSSDPLRCAHASVVPICLMSATVPL